MAAPKPMVDRTDSIQRLPGRPKTASAMSRTSAVAASAISGAMPASRTSGLSNGIRPALPLHAWSYSTSRCLRKVGGRHHGPVIELIDYSLRRRLDAFEKRLRVYADEQDESQDRCEHHDLSQIDIGKVPVLGPGQRPVENPLIRP